MFSRHTNDPVKTWRNFYFDLQTYFDGWLKESKVTTLEELKDLIVADQIKKKTPQDYKDHFLDQWCNWNNPLQLVDKLDSYEEVRNMRNKNTNFSWKQKEMESNPWRRVTTHEILSCCHMNILCQVSPVKVGGKPGFPVTVGGIPLPMTEYLRRKLWIQKKTELLYLVLDVVLPESFDQDATLATQFDKKIPCHQV
ncbi:CCHC-type domain-containing protein [Trichonephila clavipes]|nr:CCHC-type domain-containing protein [Trichonephila clavipes]